MSFVKHPNFVSKDKNGALVEIRCKVCGVPIAGMTEKVLEAKVDRNGTRVETKIMQWARFHNFVELKIGFSNNTGHITTGCNKCLTNSLTIDQLDELHMADIDEQENDLGRELAIELKARVPEALVGIKPGGGMT